MSAREAKSFAEMSFLEAVARRARVEISVKSPPSLRKATLTSRLLGTQDHSRVVIEVPRAEASGEKVFVPDGADLELRFPVTDYLLSAQTTVIDHTVFDTSPTRKVEAVVLRMPRQIASQDRRNQPRHEIDPTRPINVSIWSWDLLADRGDSPRKVGRLVNWSQGGLGVSISASLPVDIDDKAVVRMEDPRSDEQKLYAAIRRHCTEQPDGKSLAGFSDVSEIQAGQATPVIESLVQPSDGPPNNDAHA